jgi:putative salt-induced outer membrane protein YdiY
MILRFPYIFFLILIYANAAYAIELFLKNGDRLLGELILESDDHLTIKHPILGELEIAKSDLAELPLEETVPPRSDPRTNLTFAQFSPGENSTGEEVDGTGEGYSMVTKIPEYIGSAPMKLIQTLEKMNAELGFSFADKSSRRDQTDLRFFYNSKWEDGRNEYRFDTDYRYSESDDDVSEDRYSVDFRFRRQQQRNLFIQASTLYKRDPIREIDHQLEQGAGIGWKNKVSPAFQYSMGGGVSFRWEDLRPGNISIDGSNIVTSVFEDSILRISEAYQLIQEAETFLNPTNSEDWGYSFDLKLDGKITKGLSVRLGYEYSFENLIPQNVPQEETLFSSSLLYTF